MKIIAVTLLLAIGLFIYGHWIDFVPTEAWKNWGTAIALVLTVACIVPLYRGKYLGRLKMQTPLSSITRIGIGIIIPILVCVMFWVGVINGVGSIATSLIGKSKSTYAKFYKEYKAGRYYKFCHYQLKGDMIETMLGKRVCISQRQFETLPNTQIPTKLEGKESILGFHVQYVNTDLLPSEIRRYQQQ